MVVQVDVHQRRGVDVGKDAAERPAAQCVFQPLRQRILGVHGPCPAVDLGEKAKHQIGAEMLGGRSRDRHPGQAALQFRRRITPVQQKPARPGQVIDGVQGTGKGRRPRAGLAIPRRWSSNAARRRARTGSRSAGRRTRRFAQTDAAFVEANGRTSSMKLAIGGIVKASGVPIGHCRRCGCPAKRGIAFLQRDPLGLLGADS